MMKRVFLAITLASTLTHSQVAATPYSWTGAINNDMTNSGNWNPAMPPGPPGPGDEGIFGVSPQMSPTIFNTGGVSNTMTTDAFSFTPAGLIFYTPTLNGQSMGAASLTLLGNGVSNFHFLTVNFNIINGGVMTFKNSATARVLGNISYSVSNTGSVPVTSLNFEDNSTTGSTTITVSVPNSEVNFKNFSNADTSTLQVQNLAMIKFLDSSSLQSGTITADGGIVILNTNTVQTGAAITLLNQGKLQVQQPFHLNTFSSADPNDLLDLIFSSALTISNSTSQICNGRINETAGNGSIIFDGSGGLDLKNPTNSYTGGTVISNGLFQVSGLGILSPVGPVTVNAPGTFQISNLVAAGLTIGDLSGSGTVNLGTKTLTFGTATPLTEMNGVITGSGGITKQGSGGTILSGVNSYLGDTLINEGTIYTGPTRLPPTSSVIIASLGTLNFSLESQLYPNPIANDGTVAVSNGQNVTLDGGITGSGQVVVEELSTLVLGGTNTYTGGTTVNSGLLVTTSDSVAPSTNFYSFLVLGTGVVDFNQSTNGTLSVNALLNDGPSTLLFETTGQFIWNGAIDGQGKVAVDSGDVIFNAVNSYTGGTTVASGAILEGFAGSLQGQIDNNGSVIFNQNVDGTFPGYFIGSNAAATIAKNGVGTLFFNNDSAGFKGTTNINQGKLVLNNVLGGNVNVALNTILAGNGRVSNHLVNSGTVAPGNSIGVMQVGGNYTQQPSGTLEIEIDSFGNTDLLDIDGTASLAGRLVIIPLGVTVDLSKTYTILHAESGVTGVFPTVVSTNPLFVPHVEYTPTDVLLNVQSLFTAVALTHNQREVAKQLETLFAHPTPAQEEVLVQLSLLGGNPETFDEVRTALSQMSGEQYTNQLLMAETATRQFLRRLFDPVRSIVAFNPCCDCCHARTLDTWASAGGGRTTLGHDRHAAGYKLNAYELSLGAQAPLNACWTVGAAGSYEHDQIHYNVGGSGKNSFGMAAAYAVYRPCRYYLLGDVALNAAYGKMRRTIDVGSLHYTARSNPKALLTTLYVEGGKDFYCNAFLFQPFLGMELDAYISKKLCEKGAAPLNLATERKSQTNVYSRLGLHLSSCGCRWKANLDLAWQYRLTSWSNKFKARFSGFGSEMSLMGVAVPRTTFDAAANVSIHLWSNLELFVEFVGQRGSRFSAFSGVGGVKYSW